MAGFCTVLPPILSIISYHGILFSHSPFSQEAPRANMSITGIATEGVQQEQGINFTERPPLPVAKVSIEQLVAGSPELPETTTSLSTWRTAVVISGLSGIGFVSSMSFGVLTISLPRIASDVGLPDNLLLW